MPRPKRTVLAAASESTTPPEALAVNQSICRVVKAEGNNLYTCQLPNSSTPGDGAQTVLVELAARFRNTIWIRRGGFVLVELTPAGERTGNSKVEGEIVNVVREEREWRKQVYWPREFSKSAYDEDDDDESNVGKLPPSDSEEESGD